MAKLLWTQKQDIGPGARSGHAMAFDAVRKRVVLFGGSAIGTLFGDTWEWDGEDWTQVEDMGPTARFNHAVAYDAGRRRVVLFGGNIGGALNADTWEWDGEDWTQVSDTGPVMRSGHAMAYDADARRVTLFGGTPIMGAPFNDTWTWDGTDWVQQEEAGPSPRHGHAMTYDSVRKRIVLFGGTDLSLEGLADTWEWDGAVWRQVADFGPPGATNAAMVFRTNRTSLFGGVSTLGANIRLFGDTWEWNGDRWTARQDIGVSARHGHAMAFDSVRGRVVLFGGLRLVTETQTTLRPSGDTWEHPDVGGPAPAEPGDDGPIREINISPNPALPGETVTITIVLKALQMTPEAVTLLRNGDYLGSLVVPANLATASYSFLVTALLGPLPVTVEITAIADEVRKTAQLTIGP